MVGGGKTLNGIVSIGKPMADVYKVILDEQGREVAQGEKGELCVAGKQVTCGYYKNTEKNAQSFFIKEFCGKQMRFYRTGDLCYEDEDGDIMYYGRIDHQAKIQGFRVEMGEIEFYAHAFLNGINVVAIPFDNAEGLTEIALFVEADEFDTKPLIEYMRSKMPKYMIPARFYFLSTFPLNNNAKTDKVILKSMIEI